MRSWAVAGGPHPRRPRAAELALAAALVLAGAAGQAAVPAPALTPARIVVSGRTSTARDVTVVRTGKDVPETFSGSKVRNTPGFDWYVSRHYALKTDYGEKKARLYLTLLELAYPHYVELFGGEPAGMDEKRMAAVYGSSKARLGKALMSDGIVWDFRGGGITFESGYRCSYAYPSGSLKYHQRYILLHEVAHLFQMCLTGTVYNTPEWYYEGVADCLSHHVYDTTRRQLTVHVLDKPTTLNFLDRGLRDFRDKPRTPGEIHQAGKGSRGQNFLLVHFFLDHPDRAQKLRLWRDELATRAKYDPDRAGRRLGELFGPWKRIDAEFAAWLGGIASTFRYAEWGWEQDGETLWSYGYADNGRLSRTNVYLPPGEKPAWSPYRMDWPLRAGSCPLVGPVQRGVAEPAVGCLIDFSRNPGHGRAGIGMGLREEQQRAPSGQGAGFLSILVDRESRLVIDGKDVGLARKEFALPASFREAAAAGGHRIGMTVRIAPAALEVVLKAGQPDGGVQAFRASVALKPAARRRLMSRGLAILARSGYHGITPFFDDRRRAEPDLLVPAPANRWRNPGDKPLWLLYRVEARLAGRAPASLTALKRVLLDAVTRGPAAQAAALKAFDARIGVVLTDIQGCGADRKAIGLATMDIGRAISLRASGGEEASRRSAGRPPPTRSAPPDE